MTLADRLVADWYSPRCSMLVAVLRPLSMPFRAAVALRRALYRRGVLGTVRLSVPVVVVGNITVGGSGKTPLVAALARALARRGRRPGIVSRGYGRAGDDGAPIAVAVDDDPDRVGDEPLLLARTGFPVVVARDRVAAGRTLVAAHPQCDVILADDGLQHYRLARAFEIAVVDTTRPPGRPWLLPAGPLREPPSRLAEVDAVVALVPAGATVPAGLRGAYAMSLVGETFVNIADRRVTTGAAQFAGAGVHALAGIGNPARFFTQLRTMGIAATAHPLPDHHRFRAEDIAIAGARAILMTEKDALKCETFADGRCWYLPVEARIDDALVAMIEGRLDGSQAA